MSNVHVCILEHRNVNLSSSHSGGEECVGGCTVKQKPAINSWFQAEGAASVWMLQTAALRQALELIPALCDCVWVRQKDHVSTTFHPILCVHTCMSIVCEWVFYLCAHLSNSAAPVRLMQTRISQYTYIYTAAGSSRPILNSTKSERNSWNNYSYHSTMLQPITDKSLDKLLYIDI